MAASSRSTDVVIIKIFAAPINTNHPLGPPHNPPIGIKIAAATRTATMNTPAVRSVSFAVAPPAPAADSAASRSPSAGLNAVPIAPHHPHRDHCPSSLSTDPYAQRHVEGAIHRRAINSPPKSPLHSTRRSLSIPAAHPHSMGEGAGCGSSWSRSCSSRSSRFSSMSLRKPCTAPLLCALR